MEQMILEDFTEQTAPKKISQPVKSADKDIIGPAPKTMFQCQFCPMFFSRKYSLKGHIDSVHNGKKYNCQFCSMFYLKITSLKSHVDSVHNGIRLGWEMRFDILFMDIF
jgi:hypothetical protein